MKYNRITRMVVLGLVILLNAQPANSISSTGISSPVREILCGIWQGFISLAAALASFVFIVAGVQWIYNADDPGKRKAAKDIMVQAIVGLVIVGVSNDLVTAVNAGGTTFKGCTKV